MTLHSLTDGTLAVSARGLVKTFGDVAAVDGGRAEIFGVDVRSRAHEVRVLPARRQHPAQTHRGVAS